MQQPTEAGSTGVVFRKSLGEYAIAFDNRIVTCALSNRLRKQLVYPLFAETKIRGGLRGGVVAVDDIKTVDPVAIGDTVHFVPAEEGRGMIVEVLPRKSEVVRRAAGKERLKQVIVANADQVVPVMAAAQPRLVWELLDRYVAAAEEAGLRACIVITKIDLVDPAEIEDDVAVYRKLGYPVVLTSTVTGEGIEETAHLLRGKISVLAGKSGAGKSSLLNAIQPGLGLRVSEVSSSTHKGKHTTTHLEMFPLDIGGSVVDTPGMREFGLWDESSKRQRGEHENLDLAELFVDLRPHLGRCRFGLGCTHAHEPGCAVKEAVARGEVAERRYRSYLRMAEK